jgi:leucyl aminopeptidase
MMQISVNTSPAEKLVADALAVICFEDEETGEKQQTGPAVQAPKLLDHQITVQAGWMAELRSSGEFTGKLYETALLYHPQDLAAKGLVVVGGGKRTKFSSVELRRVAGFLVRSLKTKGLRTIALLLESPDHADALAVAEGAILGGWEADKYKTEPNKARKRIDEFVIVVPGGQSDQLTNAVSEGRVIADAQNFARDLVNEPANRLSPQLLAEAAAGSAAEFGLEYKALDRAAMTELGMGALLGVAQGSSNAPYLIALKYRPSLTEGRDELALVGKGVTFDTGGISIKPCDGMEKMKYDMAGAAAVIGAMRAIAQLKPSIPVTGYAPLVENMINGEAQRPGDIVTTMSGKTVEVLNTDAEGRLILADALTYVKREGATHIVDAATLTGAIGIALGHYHMGAFTNNDDFLTRFLAASRIAGEKAWQMPLDEDYKDYLKSAFADLPNVGGRYGGSITAAWFLREFADPTPWIHLDIASTAWLDESKPWMSKGPSGVAVRSFVQLALGWGSKQ